MLSLPFLLHISLGILSHNPRVIALWHFFVVVVVLSLQVLVVVVVAVPGCGWGGGGGGAVCFEDVVGPSPGEAKVLSRG